MEMKHKIKQLSEKYFDEVLQIRRNLHAHPELSFKEFKTSEYICSKLDEWGINYKKGIVKTGVLAIIDTGKKGKTIALRADMDALPIQEKNDLNYCSKNKGVMHACGHDVHISSLLGVVKIIEELKSELKGKILFVFQPGEELLPGGAKLMLEERIFDGNEPDLIVAQHVFPDISVGKVGFRAGNYMASGDEIYIKIIGKGGHAALPDRLIDPVLIASQVIVSLQQIVSRKNKPGLPTVLSFGRVIADGAMNVIPEEVNIDGTFRTMNEKWRKEVHELIRQIASHTAEMMGGRAEVEIRHGYPVLANDVESTRFLAELSSDYLGEENVNDLDIRMTAEDFAYFSQKYPSVMYRLGTSKPGTQASPLHTASFRVDEESLKHGMGLMSWLCYGYLTK